MVQGFVQIALFFALIVAVTPLLGGYMARVFRAERTFLDPVVGPLERFTYRLLRVDPTQGQDWKVYARGVVFFSLGGWLLLYLILRTQTLHPFNPEGFHSGTWDLSFNTTSSFVTNTNWQYYGGETTLSYFSQMAGLAVQNFVSAATGIIVAIALIRGIIARRGRQAVLATVGEYLFAARNAETAAGGPTSPAGQAAFQASLVNRFNTNYASAGSFWAAGPSDPTPAGLFSRSSTYVRPGTAYLALREILGSINFTRTLQQTQRDFGGASITEPGSRASSAASCPTRARRAPPGWMCSSGSGSIPPSRPAAESTDRSSSVRGGLPDPGSTTRAAAASGLRRRRGGRTERERGHRQRWARRRRRPGAARCGVVAHHRWPARA